MNIPALTLVIAVLIERARERVVDDEVAPFEELVQVLQLTQEEEEEERESCSV